MKNLKTLQGQAGTKHKGSEKLRRAWAYRQNVDELIGEIVLRGHMTFQLKLIKVFKWLTVSKALLSST